MGIKGLWQALKPYVDDGHLSQFRGQRVAVDMYVWLHRCTHGSLHLNMDTLLPYFQERYESATPVSDLSSIDLHDVAILGERYIELMLDKVAALQRYGVVPVCIFDGAEMPMKSDTDAERHARREAAFREAVGMLEKLYRQARRTFEERQGSSSAAAFQWHHPPIESRPYQECLQLLEKAVDISAEMAHVVIQVLKEERQVECFVAPYEADAQLAYLCREGYVAAAISEDSDLIAYLCPCIISKLDTFSGKCEVLQPPRAAPLLFAAIAASSTSRRRPGGSTVKDGDMSGIARTAKQVTLQQQQLQRWAGAAAAESTAASPATPFSYESFLLACIMSGCDYAANLRSIGIKTAFKIVARARSLRDVLAVLEESYGFPREELDRYRGRIIAAFYCFAHHIVYCPRQQKLTPLHPLPSRAPAGGCSGGTAGGGMSRLRSELVGQLWPAEVAQEVCSLCLKSPSTLELYRGLYQNCLTAYLQRVRRGQSSLHSYTGFQQIQPGRVVVQVGDGGRSEAAPPSDDLPLVSRLVQRQMRSEAEDGSGDAFGAPLKARKVAHGFLGSRPVSCTDPSTEQRRGSDGGEAVVVRSRYFFWHGRTAVQERWSTSCSSASDDDSDRRGGEGDAERATMAPATPRTGEPHRRAASSKLTPPVSGRSTDAQPSSSSSISAARTSSLLLLNGALVSFDSSATQDGGSSRESQRPATDSATEQNTPIRTPEPLSASEDAKPSQSSSDVAPAPAVPAASTPERVGVAAPSPCSQNCGSEKDSASVSARGDGPRQRCSCPFGYWQCNRAHSVFESCFVGKGWSKLEQPSLPASPPTITTGSSPTIPSSTAEVNPLPRPSSSGQLRSYMPKSFQPPRCTSAAAPATAPSDFREESSTTANGKCDDTVASKHLERPVDVAGGGASRPTVRAIVPPHRMAAVSASSFFDAFAFKK